MTNNGGNGTCYTKPEYDSLDENFSSEKWVITAKDDATQQENTASIQTCDNILRSVKNNLPTSKEIPEGYKALKVDLGDKWQKAGGLACANKDCPKASMNRETENNGVDRIKRKYDLIILSIGSLVFQKLQ